MDKTQHWLSNQRVIKGTTFLFYAIAQLSRKSGFRPSKNFPRLVAHISPSYFSDDSMIGGGERYPTSLAQAMTNYVETVLISFGANRLSLKQGKLRIEIYPAIGSLDNPVSYSFLKELARADIVHCHQYRTYATNLAISLGAALGKRIFVTDHGGGGSHYITGRVPLSKLVNAFLPVSAFSTKSLPPLKRTQVIYGGVEEEFLEKTPDREREKKVLFVGRILPHKGINYSIEAVDENIPLEIIGRVYNQEYFALLQELAKHKQVRFITDASDDAIREAYRSALVTVLPSVYVDINSTRHPAPELLGLVLLESMACGTPVICTNVGGMPEIVREGVTGFIVPPNDAIALREKIHWLLDHPDKARQMGQKARAEVLKNFTWDSVAKRCLEAYTQP